MRPLLRAPPSARPRPADAQSRNGIQAAGLRIEPVPYTAPPRPLCPAPAYRQHIENQEDIR